MLRHRLIRIGHNTQSQNWGVAFMMTGMFIIPLMDAIARILGQGMSPMQITWGRFAFQLVFMGIAILMTLVS